MPLSTLTSIDETGPPRVPATVSEHAPPLPQRQMPPNQTMQVREAPPPRHWKTITDPPRV